MQLTKKSSYGLIAILELAGASEESPTPASAIAERFSLSASFIEKILRELRRAGLVVSTQGRSGGYSLARDPSRISLRQVLEALGESLDLVGCVHSDAHCDLTVICPTRSAWKKLDSQFKELLEAMSVADLLAT